MSALSKFLAGLGINTAAGAPVIGIGALFYSPNIGGYQDPNFIDGYRFNPDDGKWYATPPAPDLGQFAWENPADADAQSELNEIKKLREFHNYIEGLKPGDGDKDRTLPSEIVDDLFSAARGWIAPRRDPLVFDLDGDGIETVGLNATNPILFDHDGDGIRQGTGWIAPDDAFLVLDRDGNGTIDSGRELFGDSTPLSTGGSAVDGFAALAEEDTNGDGAVNASDARFSQLRLWRDLNQDGISQSGELFTLTEAGIAAIHVAKTENNQVLADRNQIADLGTFTRTDGTVGTLGQVADVDLASDTFHRAFTDPVPLTEAAQSLPDMQGSGLVRDLREAASLSGEIAATLSAMTTDTTRAQFIAHANTLIDQWAATSTLQNSYDLATQQNLDLTFLPPGVTAEEAYFVLHEDDFGGLDTGTPTLVISDERKAEIRAQIAEIEHLIKVLEPFNGQNFLQFTDGQATDTTVGVVAWIDGGSGGSSIGWAPVPGGRTPVFGTFEQGRLDLLRQSYETLKQSVYQGLALQTWLKPYLDAVSFSVTETGLTLDFNALNARLDTLYQTDAGNAMTDLIELNRYAGDSLRSAGWTGLETLRTWVDGATGNAMLESILQELHVARGSGNFGGTTKGDILFGASGNDTVNGQAGDDTLDGGAGNDYLYGGAGNDTLLGGEGTDYLYGEAGDDVLEGGAGTDYLSGGLGNDTYRFGLGDGQDTIYSTNDPTAGKLDVLQFKDGVAAGDVRLSTSGSSLVIKLAGSPDQITVQDFLYQDDPSNAYNPLQEIRFADGTIWGLADIQARLYAGTDNAETLSGTVNGDTITGQGGADVLYGKAGDDTLDGGAGNDYLYGGAGNDTLLGGEGTDYLYGEAGDDVLEGGAGNDALFGGLGNDTYRFGLGDGQDTIYSTNDPTAGKLDVLQFKDGVAAGDVRLSTSGSSLVIKLAGTTDQITVQNFLYQDDPSNAYNPLQQITFADGTTWGLADILAKLYAGTDNAETLSGTVNGDTITGQGGADVLYGKAGDDTLDGGAGNDYLYGGAGNDTLLGGEGTDWLYGEAGDDVLEGGAGNDALYGGTGSDTYRFGLGDGQDTISDYESSANTDQLLFGADVAVDQLWFRHAGSNLEISVIGTDDKVTISNWYSGTAYHIEQFQAVDGQTLLDSQVENLVTAMAAFAPPSAGQTTLPQNYQDALNSVIAANWQ